MPPKDKIIKLDEIKMMGAKKLLVVDEIAKEKKDIKVAVPSDPNWDSKF